MLSMEKVAEVHRLKYEEGKTYLEIQELLGMSSKTVSKALNRAREFVDGYQRRAPSPRPVLGDHLKRIEELLAESQKGVSRCETNATTTERRTGRCGASASSALS